MNEKTISTEEESYFVLGWEQPNEKVAILCRGTGPALCRSWKEALKLRTNLLNDPRANRNQNAQRIIQELRIYCLAKGESLLWRPGDLWLYVDQRILKKIEN